MSEKNTKVAIVIAAVAVLSIVLYFGVVGSITNQNPAKEFGYDYLVQRALEIVNKDRIDNGLDPLALSTNGAAQAHAEDILRTRTVSHWMTNGEKPYMTYARHGGAGGIGQNVAFRGATDAMQCEQTLCDSIDPIKMLEEIEHAMMFDDEDYEWGNKGNILDPEHTHVSFGIAYDRYSFVLVQNFEYNYINLTEPIGQNLSNIRVAGLLTEGRLYNISIYYDPFPNTGAYELHKNEKSYGFGRQVAIIEPPLPPNSYYQRPYEYELIIAKNMSQNGSAVSAEFDISQVATEPGIYTLTIWLQVENTYIPATVHQIFVEPSVKGSI
jgi:hypothetical protein